jgi:hypothetical protein
MLSNATVQELYCVSLTINYLPKWSILRLGGQQFLRVVYITGHLLSIPSLTILVLNWFILITWSSTATFVLSVSPSVSPDFSHRYYCSISTSCSSQLRVNCPTLPPPSFFCFLCYAYHYHHHHLWLCSPEWAMASSSTRFLDHIRRATVGRTLLDEWSARHRDLYLTTHNKHPCPRWNSNPRSQQSGRRPTP